MILLVMEALKTVAADIHILTCPDDCRDAFEPPAASAGFVLITGPKEDVLGRYCVAIRKSRADWVIRATADNPFVFADAASALLAEGRSLGADYSAYGSLPLGAGVELVRSAALLRAETEAALPEEREHVCPYLYGHEELFSLHRPPAPPQWRRPEIRLTVDTAEDYGRAQQLYRELILLPPETRFSGESIIAAFDKVFNAATAHSDAADPGALR
jgi:spore coat polysaccharide biosynthesis protein SpsF